MGTRKVCKCGHHDGVHYDHKGECYVANGSSESPESCPCIKFDEAYATLCDVCYGSGLEKPGVACAECNPEKRERERREAEATKLEREDGAEW